MSDLFLITKSGPECKVPIEIYNNEEAANERSKALDATLLTNDAIDRLSTHEVVTVPYVNTPRHNCCERARLNDGWHHDFECDNWS
jgi:hypothetical protein